MKPAPEKSQHSPSPSNGLWIVGGAARISPELRWWLVEPVRVLFMLSGWMIVIGLVYLFRISGPNYVSVPHYNPDDFDRSIAEYSHLTSGNIGLNAPGLDNHQGQLLQFWLGADYNIELIEHDLQTLEELGIRTIRVFAPVDSVMTRKGNSFQFDKIRAAHLDDYLSRAAAHKISVILVLADGASDSRPNDLDGKFKWKLLLNPKGLKQLKNAFQNYVKRFRHHENIKMWEIMSKPYATISWCRYPQKLGITIPLVHQFLRTVYSGLKPLTSAPVGISEYEESAQDKYNVFSDDSFRKQYIDDVTDVYSMHIYRKFATEVDDFSWLTDKPKWCTELGSYNYMGEKGGTWPVTGNNELWDEQENFASVKEILPVLIRSDFKLILPWGFSGNNGVVVHYRDGTHIVRPLALWLRDRIEENESDL